MIGKVISREFIQNFFRLNDSQEDKDRVDTIMSCLERREFAAGAVICRYGERAHSMYFIESGKVSVLGEDGKTINSELDEGDYFGEYAALTGERRLATIKAKGRVTLYELNGKHLYELTRHSHKLFAFFLKHVYNNSTNVYLKYQSELDERKRTQGLRGFRNFKTGTRILAVCLTVSICTLLLMFLVFRGSLSALNNYSELSQRELGESAAEQSAEAMEDIYQAYIQGIGAEQAEWCEAVFTRAQEETSALAEFTSLLYANAPPSGEPTLSYTLAPNVTETPAIRTELRTLSGAGNMFSVILNNNPILDKLYLGMETGISYHYSHSDTSAFQGDMRTQDWYKAAMNAPNSTLWLTAHPDSSGLLCITCFRAFRGADGVPAGVVACDIRVERIVEAMSNLMPEENGYAFLLDKQGDYIAHPDYAEEDFTANALDEKDESWKLAIRSMINGRYGVYEVVLDGESFNLSAAPLEETDWILGVVILESHTERSVTALQAEIDTALDKSLAEMADFSRNLRMQTLLFSLAAFAAAAVIAVCLSLIAARPIKELALAVKRAMVDGAAAESGFDRRISADGKDEVTEIASAFNTILLDLKDYTGRLEYTSKERDSAQQELHTAEIVKNSALPLLFPSFETFCNDFSFIEGYVGTDNDKTSYGNFYDFYYMDTEKSKIAFTIGNADIYGTGGSLLMLAVKDLLKSLVMRGAAPDDALSEANKLLYESGKGYGMSAGVFLCELDLKNSLMRYASAGHKRPLVSFSNSSFRFMSMSESARLGTAADSQYTMSVLRLQSGDRFYLYTEALAKMVNRYGEEFGETELIETVNTFRHLPLKEFDAAIRQSAVDFIEGAEQQNGNVMTVAVRFLGV